MDAHKIAVVLVGHGVPATDCPPQWVGELMGLEWSSTQGGPGTSGQVRARLHELDEKIRSWPRHPGNDPYKQGLEKLAQALRPLLPAGLFAIGYNEFCRPSVQEALREVIQKGAQRILVIPSMLTPGGVHSEKDIPKALEEVQRENPGVRIEYVWPFDVKAVAELLSSHVRGRLKVSS